MNCAGFYYFEPVRFFANIDDLTDPNVSPLEQANSLPTARLAFGIGTSQVRDVLATQTLAMDKLKVRRVNVNGSLGTGVYAKDVILNIIRRLGVSGGKGFAYEYGGAAIDTWLD